ncbi:MAG TPA: poly-gamma-glutamate system protein [Bacteroidales bacterium]|nr:poly-gamma-glutamate system protein [Bacteroidales bacterium]HRX95550.1 poly-gamma-glutamate system protein [Bacteroidales bacterium]
MITFRAKSNKIIGALSVLALLAFLAVENSKVDVRQKWYREKLEAATLSAEAAYSIKQYRLNKGIFVDEVNDPNQTALIGQEYTLITTDRGYIDSKLATTNPNFAAMIVQLLKEAGVEKGDQVAVAFTGSFPALNISVMAALETLQIKPVIITSVGASNFGANDPYFTWLDMESYLYDAGVFHNKSVAASIGGGFDLGRGLSPEGRDLIENAIHRNKVDFIHEKHLDNSIARRLEIYDENSNGLPYKAYINVGGGIASLGNTINGKLIPVGLTQNLPVKNYPVSGVIVQMGQRGMPIIHLLNINQLIQKYNLQSRIVPLPEPGEGGIFVQKKYNIVVTAVATLIMIVIIVLMYMSERKYHRLGTDVVYKPDAQASKDHIADEGPVL